MHLFDSAKSIETLIVSLKDRTHATSGDNTLDAIPVVENVANL
jgi:hypothetical protein